MQKHSFYLLPLFFAALFFVVAGFIIYFHSNGKISSFNKVSSTAVNHSTGTASLSYEDGKAAEFVGHYLIGHKYPNALYQGFLAIHFDEMDSVLTKHSSVGRTNARNNPGDKNTFQRLSGGVTENLTESVDSMTFTFNNITNRLLVHQTIETKKDSSHFIYMTYVFEFIKPLADTATFSNVKILFGYDGDIGNSLGGYSDDSSGYYEDDSTALVYIFDDSLKLYSGIGIIDKKPNAVAGNYALLHHTVNQKGATDKSLDTLLYDLMNHPVISSELVRSDFSVYWAIDLGTIIPSDTLRDTIRFAWVNGVDKSSLLQASKGRKTEDVKSESFSESKIPSRVFLYPSYPNPFNPETILKYELDREEFVSLKVYNLLGQEVRVLFQGRQGAGEHLALWDGRDKRGKHLSSGVYISRLQAGKVIQSRKLILMK